MPSASSAPSLLDTLASFVRRTHPSDVPVGARAAVCRRVLDTLGVSLGALPLDTSKAALRLGASWGGVPQATAIGIATLLPAPGAAFVNGTLAHSLDFDDTHLPSVLHPSASLIPAMLAVGDAVDAHGSAALAAAALGYEVCIRTGMAAYDRALGNSIFFERGWHATSICGTLGAAALAARLYDIESSDTPVGHAIAIAASFGAGLLEGNRAGGSVKRLHCGWAAHGGIVAAQAAREGFTGPSSVFEGRFGFYEAFCGGRFDAAELTSSLGERWVVEDIFYKPYPANHFTHGAIDAARRLRERLQLQDRVDEIARIDLKAPTATLRTIAQPAEVKARPATGYQAQFSGPFAVAAAILGGGGLGLALEDFSDANATDDRYRQLMARVHCSADAECDAIFPRQFPAIVSVTMRDGRSYEERVMANRGGPDWPLTDEELRVKFMSNATRAIEAGAARELADAILALDECPVREVTAVLRRAVRPVPGDRP
ncbi:MAG TPA: MmgE/PrpD family protein [Vicinamibacterales bacterium]